ncbi:MAG TPA: class E sortase [Acidimicrobiales bacterium]|nr:class E sortase [Acidimicrobiales bacterium]
MTDNRRFLLALVSGLLFASGCLVLVLRTTAPAQAAADSPLLRPAPTTTTTVADTSTTAAPEPAPAPVATKPVEAPRDPYADEPIRQIGTIEIPKIGLVHPVFEGISLRNIDQGPSHWPGTAMPGQPGNAVFAGHRVTHTHPFRNIDQLVPGDDVFFDIGGVRTHYVVTGHEVVTPKEVRIVDQTVGPTATLFACHPPHSASYRYVVHLSLAPETVTTTQPAG